MSKYLFMTFINDTSDNNAVALYKIKRVIITRGRAMALVDHVIRKHYKIARLVKNESISNDYVPHTIGRGKKLWVEFDTEIGDEIHEFSSDNEAKLYLELSYKERHAWK